MITKKGHQCKRWAISDVIGFCKQHSIELKKGVLSKQEVAKSRWERFAITITAVQAVIELIKLAVTHLGTLHGSGDAQLRTKEQLKNKLKLGPQFPSFGDSYRTDARVDWIELNEIYDAAAKASAGNIDVSVEIALRFDQWFERMNEYHQEQLVKALESQQGETKS